MAITREKKTELVNQYAQGLKSAKSAVLIQQVAISVNDMTEMRKELTKVGSRYQVVRKRLLLRAIEEVGFKNEEASELEGSVAVVYATDDGMWPLKVLNTFSKKWEKDETWTLSFLGGWFEKNWKPGDYVTELASIPSREELLSKLAYLLNYPVQSFATVLDEVSKKAWWDVPVKEAKIEEVKE